MEKELKGYIKIEKVFYLPTGIGDRWLNKEDYDFEETKSGKVIVDERKEEK